MSDAILGGGERQSEKQLTAAGGRECESNRLV